MIKLFSFSPLAVFMLFGITRATCNATRPAISCDAIPTPDITGAQVISFTTELRTNLTENVLNPITGNYTTTRPLNVCTVNVTLTHPGANDEVMVWVWLPIDGWNGRFQGVGGSGWQAGIYGVSGLGLSALEGYAAASTDGSNIYREDGLDKNLFLGPGKLDLERIADFSYRALHEVAVVGKAVTASFYGRSPSSFPSYWNGCSQGGRQGYMLAQRYPDDFDGIMAIAPALYWPNLALGLGWARHALRVLDYTPSYCIMQSIRDASVQACDAEDGVEDGVISDSSSCLFDPISLVGREVVCAEGTETISNEDVLLSTMIREGPRSVNGTALWDGFDWGTDYLGLLPASLTGGPRDLDNLPRVWIQFFLEKNPDFDVSELTTIQQFIDYYATYGEWGGIMATDIPDLSAFRDAGGKLITWHGTSDELIPVNSTIRYRQQVEGVMGGSEQVDQFYKFYVAPGAGHCIGGAGALPQDVMQTLEAWVERNEEPGVLRGTMINLEGQEAERIICPFPARAVYDGRSNPNDASSFECRDTY